MEGQAIEEEISVSRRRRMENGQTLGKKVKRKKCRIEKGRTKERRGKREKKKKG